MPVVGRDGDVALASQLDAMPAEIPSLSHYALRSRPPRPPRSSDDAVDDEELGLELAD